MWLMLQQKKPEDYVIATGRQASVRTFVEMTALKLNWNKEGSSQSIIWEGEGTHEIGRRADNGNVVIKIDKRYYRPSEVDNLLGDSSKARTKLGWEPAINLEELVGEMVEYDLEEIKKEKFLSKNN